MARIGTFLAGAAATAVAACTPVEWQYAGTGMPAPAAELSDCDRSAYYEAQQQAFFYGFTRPRYFVGRDGQLHYDPWLWPNYNDTFFLERQLFDYCMRAKGYRLTPVRPADQAAR